MSPLAAPLASVIFFSGFAIAQIFGPNCHSSWNWTFNSLGQDPCTVAAYMLSTCSGGSFTIQPLKSGNVYFGPSALEEANLCMCSTVGYSLTSACGGCQQGEWITWSDYAFNCSNPLPPSQFPNPIPSGTRVPGWALLDVTKENNWDFNQSYAIGDSNELGPGETIGPSSSGRGHSSSTGAIAGGIVGGIAVIAILAAGLFLYRRRRHLRAASAGDGAFSSHMDEIQGPMSGQETVGSSLPETTTPLMKPYNPDDPTTYPALQVPNPRYSSAQASSSSSTRNVYTVASIPSSPNLEYNSAQKPSSASRNLFTIASIPNSPAPEYRGLPIV